MYSFKFLIVNHSLIKYRKNPSTEKIFSLNCSNKLNFYIQNAFTL